MVLWTRHVWAAAVIGSLSTAGAATAAEYVVKLKDASLLTRADVRLELGATVLETHAAGALAKVELGAVASPAAEAQALIRLLRHPQVAYAVPNFKLDMLGVPNDPRFAEQWALAKVRAADAWSFNVGSRRVTVAVIDTGVDYLHPDLGDNVWTNPGEVAGNGRDDDGNGLVDDVHGWDFLDNDADPQDVTSNQNPGHGTHCAGIIGAVGDNARGTSGISQQVSVIPLRFIGPTGQGDLMAAIRAIDYAIAVKADVISASWGAQVSAAQAQPLIEAIGRADQAGITFVAAAANNGVSNDETPMFPANADFAGMVAVAASDSADAKPDWSNFGRAKVALAAPGLKILSTLPGDTYGDLSGTSMATPLVAGLIALLKAEARDLGRPALTGAAAESLLQTTGVRVAIETACMCRVDAAAALAALDGESLVVVPAAATFALNATGRLGAYGGTGEYSFQSMDPAVLDVAVDGALTARALGETTVRVTDSAGATAESLTLRVAEESAGGEECPFGDPALCALMCALDPTLPWCQ